MAEETTETTTETTATETVPDTVTADELRGIIGEEIEAKLATLDLSRLDKLDILDSLESLFEKNKPAGNGSGVKLSDIEGLIDRKLSSIGGGNGSVGRKPGWLGRYLSSSPNGD